MGAVSIHRIDIRFRDVEYSLAFTPVPVPQSRPNGWTPGPGDTPMRLYHDDKNPFWYYAPRTLQMSLSITNEITKTEPPNKDQTKVDSRSQIVMPMQKRRDWLDWFVYTHGARAAAAIYTPKYGYFDGKANPENPDELTPANPYKLLIAGGQLVNVRHMERGYAFVEAQRFANGPDYTLTYQTHPHLILKQLNVGNRPDKSMFLQVDKGEVGGVGDVYLPLCSPELYKWLPGELASAPLAAVKAVLLERFPELPFRATLHGRSVTITEYCFSGSNVWGYVGWGDMEAGWYMLEEMLVTGNENDRTKGGNDQDRRVYISPWLHACPIPVIGWIRQ